MAAGKHRRTGIVAAGYRVSWTGDLANDVADLPTVGRPGTSIGDVPPLADRRALAAERAAAKHVACSRPRVTRQLLADLLAGLQRL